MTSTVACPTCHEPVIPGAQFCPKCGGDVSGPQGILTTAQVRARGVAGRDSSAELLGVLREATLGEYDIVGELGRGGMAIVYLAHDIALDRKVAIKVMNPSLLIGEGMTERFKREARTAASLTHPNIIPIHLVRESERLLYFVMKYVEGRSLDSIIAETGPLPIKMVQTILAQVGAALGYAHRRGVVHRDVKPANILIDSEGWVVVTDFGIAKVAEAGNLTVSGTTVGTPYYMSPEQCSARPVTGSSDQYSLGIVGFEMLVGRPPFAGDTLMEIMRLHFFEAPPPVQSERPDCPPALGTSIDRMLAKEPRQRWPSIEDAIAATGSVPLGHGDPIRTRLSELAKSGVKPVARMSTPASPAHVRRATTKEAAGVVPPKRAEASTARAWPRLRRPVVLGAIVVTLIGAAIGIYRLLRVTPTEPARSGAIVPQPDSVASVEIAGAPATIEEGQQVHLTATAKTASGKTIDSASVVWSIGDTAVAVVSRNGVLSGVKAGITTLSVASGGIGQRTQITVKRASVASLEIVPTSLVLGVRRSAKVTAVLKDARGNPLPGRSITWATRDRAIVTVSAGGVVVGVAPGTALLDASSEGKSAGVRVTVVPASVASLVIEPASADLQAGETLPLRAIAKDSDGQRLDGRHASWSSSDPSIASVSSEGIVTALSAGVSNVIATSESRTASARVTVREAAVASIVIVPAAVMVGMRGTAKVTAAARDARNRELVGRSITWSSENSSIATVSETGVVTGVAVGSTSLVAASGGIKERVGVTVTAPAVASVVIAPLTPSLLVGDSASLTAVARDSGREILSGRRVTWTSSDTTVAAISAGGTVLGLTPGTARITAKIEQVSTATTVTVARPAPGTLSLLIQPWGNLWMEGRSQGEVSLRDYTLLSRVTYKLHIEHPGYETVDTSVTLKPGETRPLTIILVKRRNP